MEKKETKKAAKARQIAERIAEKERIKEANRSKVFSTPVAIAVEPLRVDAMQEAKDYANEKIKDTWHKINDCSPASFDIDAVAPDPDYSMRRTDRQKYDAMNKLRGKVDSISRKTKPDDYYCKTRVICEERISHIVIREQEMAAQQYESFVYKLVRKIGDHVAAELSDISGVWTCSILTVTLADGTKQRWKTKRIMNRSVLGKLFFQWPTRLMK